LCAAALLLFLLSAVATHLRGESRSAYDDLDAVRTDARERDAAAAANADRLVEQLVHFPSLSLSLSHLSPISL
jgi:hypothetical protein